MTWDIGVDLEGFELVVEAADETRASGASEASPDEDDTEDAVGFGVGTAALALLSAAALVVRKRR